MHTPPLVGGGAMRRVAIVFGCVIGLSSVPVRAEPAHHLKPPSSEVELPAHTFGANASMAPLSVDRLVQNVLAHNPGIDAMRAAVRVTRANVESAGSLADPVISYLVAPRTAGGPRQGLNQNVQFSQQLPWPGTLNLRRRSALSESRAADASFTDLRLRLTATTRATYAQWFYVHRALEINARNQALLKQLKSVAEAAYASGQTPQQDVLQAQVEIVRLHNQALELERLRRTVRARLNALQNRSPNAPLAVPAGLPKIAVLPSYSLLRNEALARFPALRGQDARVSAARDRLDLAHKDRYPHLKIMAGYNSIMDAPAKRLTVGIALSVPFGGNHRGEIHAATARVDEAEARLLDARNRLLSDLDQTYSHIEQDRSTIDLYVTHLLQLARLNLKAAEADYGSGTGDFLKVITAEQQYLRIEMDLARTRADLFAQWASLDYRTGGALANVPAARRVEDITP